MIDPEVIKTAVAILRKGGLVAFPTETVYGLGGDASNETSVKAIFRVKGRPETHPLIVHLHSVNQVENWAEAPPQAALDLGRTFWPGPLTLILKKAKSVSNLVTGGQDTVGLRIPDHPVALAFLKEFGGGVAAPSANRFGRVSPTSAAHVRQDLGTDVDFILDGGACSIGVESTILDFSSGSPVILRPGGLTRERLEEALGKTIPVKTSGAVRVSGQLESHYAPRALVVVVPPADAPRTGAELREKGKNVVILVEKDVVAQELYASLRRADDSGAEVIVVPLPEETGLGLAVADRLRKAAGKR
jgi:L-threonylcarbamoyladenylate synthase